ncbi:protein yellow [Orussus abietinus]|uniref:protein yellow n=1 Tax=Orussus abietinus TaxID=222816 RepID=UPI0006253D76|nr:protein yellow [Orussus abietinus]
MAKLRSFLLLLGLAAMAASHPLEEVYSWKQVDYNFPNDSVRQKYIATGDFIQENNLPLGLNIWKNKMFITVPRWKKGIAANLNYFLMNETNSADAKSPKLTPYPDWETNDINSSSDSKIVNFFRVRVDACDRLWGVDTGVDDIVGDGTSVIPSTLVVFDLNTDKIIRRYPLKDSDKKPDSFFADLVVDVDRDDCDNAHAYISDIAGYGLVVYSWAKNDSWRVEHNYFYFDPLNGDFNVSGFNFQWTDGVFGLSLSGSQKDGSKTLYFHAMSGITEFLVSTDILKNETLATTDNYYHFRVVGDKGPRSQGPSSIIDPETGINYFTQVQKNGIACWDTNEPLNSDTLRLVDKEDVKLLFPNDLTIDRDTRKLYVLADNLPTYLHSLLDVTKENFFITAANLDILTELCKGKGQH